MSEEKKPKLAEAGRAEYEKPQIEESATFETLAASCSKSIDDGSGAPFLQLCMGGPISAS